MDKKDKQFLADIEVKKMNLKAGDVIVLKTHKKVSDECYSRTYKQVKNIFFNNKVMFLEDNMELEIISVCPWILKKNKINKGNRK